MERGPGDAFVEVGRTVEIDGHRIEILRTLADCIGTTLYFRSDRDSRLTPRPVWPPEITGNWGAHGGDIMEAGFDPVLPDRNEIKVVFGSFMDNRYADSPITIPVDRERTARFERRLGEPRPPAVETDGIAIEVTNARVGVLRGVVDLLLTARDESILACEIGWPHRVHAPPGPGSSALWADWPPRESIVQQPKTTRGPGGMTTVSMSQSISVTGVALRARSRPPGPERPSPPQPQNPVVVRTMPEGTLLGGVGAHRTSERLLLPTLEARATATHDPPGPEASGVELALSGLYLFRFASGEIITVSSPRTDAEVDLTGTIFETDHGPVELLRWEPGYNVIPTLVVRTPSPWWWPDIRVIHGEESVSLWMHPGMDGTVTGGLPQMYEAAFQDPAGVRLALRLLGRPAPEVRIPIALSPPGS
jgi:hypothetical protein